MKKAKIISFLLFFIIFSVVFFLGKLDTLAICGDGICENGEEKIEGKCTNSVPPNCSWSMNCSQDCGESCARTGEEGDVFGKKCCSGLTAVPINVEPINGECLGTYPPYGTQFLCINCGDGICGVGENKCNCPKDCTGGSRISAMCDAPICKNEPESKLCVNCGNGICNRGENICSCPEDCKSRSACGNGVCEEGENLRALCPTSNCEGYNCPSCQMVCEIDCSKNAEPIMNPNSVCGNGVCEHERCEAVGCNDKDERDACPQDCVGEKSPIRTALNIVPEQKDNETKLTVELSNGKKAEIKVMPETASQRAIERLGLNVCNQENNCVIELKEVGKGENMDLAYEVKAKKEYRILWIFKIKADVKAEVNAENGEVISTKKPWWRFLTW